MSKVSLKSYAIPKIIYDIGLVDASKSTYIKTDVKIKLSKKDDDDNKMQIDVIVYTDKDTPYIKLSIIGVFAIDKELDKEDIEDKGELLKKEGSPMLYEKLRACHSEIVKKSKISFPQLPPMDPLE